MTTNPLFDALASADLKILGDCDDCGAYQTMTRDALPPEVADLAADADVPGPRCPACGRPTARRSLVASCAFRHAGHRGDDEPG